MRRLGRGLWLGLAVLALSGATRPAEPTSPPPRVLIDGVPHVRQLPDFCGEACVAMFCASSATTSISARSSIARARIRGWDAARTQRS